MWQCDICWPFKMPAPLTLRVRAVRYDTVLCNIISPFHHGWHLAWVATQGVFKDT